jgi:hypothetical protein
MPPRLQAVICIDFDGQKYEKESSDNKLVVHGKKLTEITPHRRGHDGGRDDATYHHPNEFPLLNVSVYWPVHAAKVAWRTASIDSWLGEFAT